MKQSIISELLKRPVAYQPTLAKAFDSINLAILWGQLYYWHDKGHHPDGWIYKTNVEIYDETALSRKEQETARKKGIALGVMDCQRMGEKGVMHYKINIERAHGILIAFLGDENIELPKSGKRSEAKPKCECFDLFWAEYPRNENKKKAKEKFEKIDHDLHQKIIDDVKLRKQKHGSWLEGFIPHATTYLNEERWNDEIRPSKNIKSKVNATNEQMSYLQHLSKK